jgi:hypothetical protein
MSALCEIAQAHEHRLRMVSVSIPSVGGSIMLTKESLSKIADVVLLVLFALAAVFVTMSAIFGPTPVWILQ